MPFLMPRVKAHFAAFHPRQIWLDHYVVTGLPKFLEAFTDFFNPFPSYSITPPLRANAYYKKPMRYAPFDKLRDRNSLVKTVLKVS